MALKIGMILDHEFPPDPRVENEAVSLVKAGFEVHLLSFNYGDKGPYEIFKEIHVHRVTISKGRVKKLRALVNTFPFYNMYLKKEIESFVAANAIEVLHIHDLYLIGAALKANKNLHLPLVADLHENYVEGLKHYQFSTTFPGTLLISIPKWEKTEKEWVTAVDRVIVVIEEAVQRLKVLGVPDDKITVIPNYVNIDSFIDFGVVQNIMNRFKNAFVVSYLGGFDLHRGLESVIKAMPAIIKHAPKTKLVLVGRGKNSDALRQMARKLGIASHICFEGWQDFQKFPSYIEASDVCLIPHLKNVHTDNTIPHKLFHYMLMEKPVVVSDCNPLRRIVEETRCGLVFESNNPEQLAARIIELFENPQLRAEFGQHGREAVSQKYNWTTAAKQLVTVYRQLEQDIAYVK
jgi:glycosyltransferase involved in cell wall biosynthesis